MGIYDKCIMKCVARRSMTIYFLIDTTTSMKHGGKMDTVNSALAETVPLIRELSANNADAEIKISLLSTTGRWIVEGPIAIELYNHTVIHAGGCDNMCAVYDMLNIKLKNEAEKNQGAGCYAPVFIYMSDGGKGQGPYKSSLNTIWNNPWFSHGIKVAIGIGQDAHWDILCDFTRCNDTVLQVHSRHKLRKLIQFVTVQSSQIASKSSPVINANHLPPLNPKLNGTNASQGMKPSQNAQSLFSNPFEEVTLSELNKMSPNDCSQIVDSIQSKQDEFAKTIKLFTASEEDDDEFEW